jgi:hypothetical protein
VPDVRVSLVLRLTDALLPLLLPRLLSQLLAEW